MVHPMEESMIDLKRLGDKHVESSFLVLRKAEMNAS
jgi:hypothetical protein